MLEDFCGNFAEFSRILKAFIALNSFMSAHNSSINHLSQTVVIKIMQTYLIALLLSLSNFTQKSHKNRHTRNCFLTPQTYYISHEYFFFVFYHECRCHCPRLNIFFFCLLSFFSWKENWKGVKIDSLFLGSWISAYFYCVVCVCRLFESTWMFYYFRISFIGNCFSFTFEVLTFFMVNLKKIKNLELNWTFKLNLVNYDLKIRFYVEARVN